MKMENAGCVAKYILEVVRNSRSYNKCLSGITPDRQISRLFTKRPLKNSYVGTFGTIFYDMCTGKKSLADRRLVGENSSKILLLETMVDDIMDQRQTPLEEKCRFMHDVFSDMFGTSCHSSPDLEEEASYVLARSINSGFIQKYDSKRLRDISSELIPSMRKQFTESDSSGILRVSKKVGSCSADSSAVLSEIVVGSEQSAVRNSARKIGEYARFLDDLHDIDIDLKEGTNTYPTIIIRERGDNPSVRNDLKKEVMTIAEESAAEGSEGLDQGNKRMYKSLRAMIDFKYRYLK